MQLAKWITCLAGAAIISAATAAPAQAQAATFTQIKDAVTSRFFDALTSRPDPLNPNRLIIGLNTGVDSRTGKSRVFKASTAAFSYTAAMDTISFVAQAPTGYYIYQVIYSQRGSGSILRTGKVTGGGTWVVNNAPASLGTFTTNPGMTRTLTLSGRIRTLPVSITQSLSAYATVSGGSATVSITGADVRVVLKPL
jgi:hypothetical protein